MLVVAEGSGSMAYWRFALLLASTLLGSVVEALFCRFTSAYTASKRLELFLAAGTLKVA